MARVGRRWLFSAADIARYLRCRRSDVSKLAAELGVASWNRRHTRLARFTDAQAKAIIARHRIGKRHFYNAM